MALTAADITRAFQNALGRDPTNDELNSYVAVAQSGALADDAIYRTISNSQEANQISDPVVRFYQAVFGRVPDAAGLNNTQDYIRAFTPTAATYITLAEQFSQTQEFTNTYGSGTAVTAVYVQALYNALLNRDGTPAEINAFVTGSNGYTTRGGVLYAISQSNEAINISDNAVNGFLQNAAEGDAVYSGSLYVPANGAPNVPGATIIPLETRADALTGGNGNEIFVGTLADGQNSTLQSGDTVNGGGGTDTLRIIATNAAAQTVVPNLTSIENIEYQGFAGATNVLNLTNSGGVQDISLASGNSSLTVNNVTNLVTAGATNTTGGTLTLNYAPSLVSGQNDTQSITVSNANATTFEIQGIETVNLSVTSDSDDVRLTSTALKTVNVSGAGAIELDQTFAATVTTLNASQNTGGVDARFAAGGNVTATGGSGDDVFRFGEGLTTADVVNGGAGFDTVRVNLAETGGGVSNIESADAAAAFNALTSIERVRFDGAEGVVINGATFTNTGITNLQFNTSNAGGAGANVDTINNAGSARIYEFGTTNDGDAVFNLNGTSTVLNIDLLGTDEDVAVNGLNNTVEVDALAVNLAGTQPAGTTSTINLSSVGNFTASTIVDGATLGLTAGTFNSVGVVTAASGSTVVLDGEAALDIAGFTNNVTVNASGQTASLVIQGSAFAAGGVGSAGTATTTTQGIDNITLGTARDVVQFAANGLDSGVIQFASPGGGAAAVANGNILVDTITGFTAGANGDVLDIVGTAATYTALAATSQAAINQLAGAGATLQAAANLATSGNTALGWTAFAFQGQTYALFEGTADGGAGDNFTNADTLVKLAGISVADLTTANFA